MSIALADISWLAVVLAVVVSAVLGGLWFAVVVPRQYLAALGRTADSPAPADGELLRNLGPVLCQVLVVLTSAWLVAALDLTSATDGVVLGLLVGIGYLGSMTLQIALNPNFPHPVRYTLVNLPYFVVTSVATTVLLVVLR